MPVVELAGVTKAYENKVAVDNLGLSIEAGRTLLFDRATLLARAAQAGIAIVAARREG